MTNALRLCVWMRDDASGITHTMPDERWTSDAESAAPQPDAASTHGRRANQSDIHSDGDGLSRRVAPAPGALD